MPRLLLLASLVLLLGVPSAAHAVAPAGFVGMVSEDTLAGDTAYRDRQLSSMQSHGVTLLRQTFDWASIERLRGHYDFTVLDGFVGAAAAHGITVMPILFNPPAFRSSRAPRSKVRGTFPPKRTADMARFAAIAARRYGPNGAFWQANAAIPKAPVRSWQVWNEPNLAVYWRPKPNPKGYVRLLAAVSKALRAVDPAAEVVSAGLPQSRAGVPLAQYVKSMLRAGAAKWMSTLAVNPYASRPQGVLTILRNARKVLNANGASRVGLRATELGWSDVGPRSIYKAGRAGQASRVRTLIKSLGSQRRPLKLRGFVYFNWKDAPPYPGFHDFWGLHTGLITKGGSAKRALTAFGAATAAL
jgi:Beta-galactosidase